MSSEQIVQSQQTSMRIQEITNQVILIQECMKAVMRDKEHFGLIPGCGKKPALFKAGAEKLCLLFRMDPDFLVEVIESGQGHRECRVKCVLYSIESGRRLGAGVGACSTMESKYRYRAGIAGESTGKPVPKRYWDLKNSGDKAGATAALGGKGFFAKKSDDGDWEIFQQSETGDKVENPDPADQYNTVLKMAKKRALVDAVLTVTAASDIFTQDIEDLRTAAVDVEFSEVAEVEPAKGKSDSRSEYIASLQADMKAKGLSTKHWPGRRENAKSWGDYSTDELIALEQWIKSKDGDVPF